MPVSPRRPARHRWQNPQAAALGGPEWKEVKACAGSSQTVYECATNRKTATEDTCDCLSSGVFSCKEWNAGFGGQNWPAECFPVWQVGAAGRPRPPSFFSDCRPMSAPCEMDTC